MDSKAPRILIFGLGGACAQSALKYLSKTIPNGVFTGWSRSPQKLPPDIQALCQAIKSEKIEEIQNPKILDPYDLIIFTPPARFLPEILKLSHCPIVALGSTRKFTKWPDRYALEVLRAEKLLFEDHRPAFLLHPTMIFGNEKNGNLSQLAKIVKKFKILPLPLSGKNRIQPIHYEDVGKSLAVSAGLLLKKTETSPRILTIAGAQSFSYQEVIHLLSEGQNLSRRLIVPFPLPCLLLMRSLFEIITIGFSKHLRWVPTKEALRRLTEDKAFPIREMEEILGFSPKALTWENWQKKLCLKRQRINPLQKKKWGE